MPESVGPPCLALRGVTAEAPDGTRLLDDVSFSAERGQLVSVVGPTGAGKTSLARVLAGALPITSGTRSVNGSVGFVPQHDTLHLGLTLRRALAYAAALRVDNPDERDGRVAAVISELGLERHADTVVRDLSVGQRKRATVAAQLLSDPDVIVLDEPTAGLDPGYERVVRDMLRTLANAGRTVITVTHSVDALQASDRVLFLAAGGSVAFFGTPKESAKYFGAKDPADVFLALDTAPHHVWQTKFRSSPLFARYLGSAVEATAAVPRPRSGGRGVLAQTALLTKRHFEMLRRDRRHLALLALQAPVIGALLWAVLPSDGLVPSQARAFSARAAVVVMFVVLSTTWLGVTNAIREIVKEQAIVRSEASAGMSARSYIAAKAISVGSITVVQSAIIALLATARQGAPSGLALTELVVIAGASGLAAATLGLAISAWAKSADKALAILPIALVLQLVLAGGWAEDARMPLVGLVRTFIGARWGMAAMEAVLRGNAGDWWVAMSALAALTTIALATAVWRIQHLTQPHGVSPSLRSAVPSIAGDHLRVAGAGLAVVASLAAGGTGVMALTSAKPATSVHVASAPTPTTTVAKHTAPPVTVAVTTPTTAAPSVPVTAPPVTAAPKKAAAPVVADTADDTTAVSIPIVRDVPVTVPEVPVTTTPTTVPKTTPTTNPWQGLINMFNPFAPRSDR
jgi:ABC-type multidrug transport system ATPase subunit